jgi:hypothetical protein
MEGYWSKCFNATVSFGNDDIEVNKNSGGDWSSITMCTNGNPNGDITIRSREHAEQLHFLLGQMLGKG